MNRLCRDGSRMFSIEIIPFFLKRVLIFLTLLFNTQILFSTTYYLKTANAGSAQTASNWYNGGTGGGGSNASSFGNSSDVFIISTGQSAIFAGNTSFTATLTIQTGSTVTINNSVNLTISTLNVECGGTSATTINGSGTLTFNGNVNVTDKTTGTVGATILAPIALGGTTRTLTVADDGTSADDLTISGVISGSGGITKAGNGTLSLSGTNTYSGVTTINAGTIKNGYNAALGATNTALGNATGNTVINSGGTFDIYGYRCGQEAFDLHGGTITNSYNGRTTEASQSIQKLTVSANSYIRGYRWDVRKNEVASAGVIIQSGVTLYKEDVDVNNNKIYFVGAPVQIDGNIVINGGRLQFENVGTTIGSGSITINANTVFSLSNSTGNVVVTNPITINDNGSIMIPNHTTSTKIHKITGNLTFTGTKNPIFDIYSGLTLEISSSVVINTPVTFNCTAGTDTKFSGIISGTGSITKSGAGNLTLSGANTFSGGYLHTAGDVIVSNNSALGTAGAVMNGTGRIILSNGVNVSNSLTVTTGNPSLNYGIIHVESGSATWSGNVTLNQTGIPVGGLFACYGTQLTVTGSVTGVIGSIIQVRYGNVLLMGGGSGDRFNLGEGTINLGANNALPSNTDFTQDNDHFTTVLNLKGFNQEHSSISSVVTSGSHTITNNSSMPSILTLSGVKGTDATYNGTITGNLSIVKNGSTVQTISGTCTYTGSTTINAGTWKLGGSDKIPDASPFSLSGTLDLNGFNETVSSLSGGSAGIVDNVSGGGTSLLTAGGDNSNTRFSGVMKNTTGTLSFTKVGSGTLILDGDNTLSGTTTISAGTLQLGNGGTSGSIASPSLVNNGSLTYNHSNSSEYAGVISGTGPLTVQAGTFVLSGNNTYSGGTTINFGATLQLGNGGSSGSITGNIVNNGTLIINRNDAYTLNGNISGTGVVIISGLGTITLSGTNSYSGSTTVQSGILKLGSNSALGTNAAGTFVSSGASLDLNGLNYSANESLSIAGVGNSGNGALQNTNVADALYNGGVTLSAATTVNASNQITLSGTISNYMDLTKTGSDDLVFTNNSVQINNLLISAGSIKGGNSNIYLKGNFTSDAIFTPESSHVYFNGTTLQTIGANISFNNTTIDNTSNVQMDGSISVSGTLTLTHGILNTKGFVANLGSTGVLVENSTNPTSYDPISYVIGNVRVVSILMRNVANTFSGIGLELTESIKTNNSTEVIRSTGTAIVANGKSSTLRSFTINPADDIGLNGTMKFKYFDHEIVGHTEANLRIFKSTDGQATWKMQNNTVDAANNTLILTGVTTFSDWTASDGVTSSLPISLVSFNAELNNEIVLLTWKTASEKNNHFFTIEKSTNGIDWNIIVIINGAGTTSNEKIYSFIDNEPNVGINYYRLVQTDFNGDNEIFPAKSILFKRVPKIGIIAYPNPVYDNLYLDLIPADDIDYKCVILNETGQEIVHEVEIALNNVFDLSYLSPGTYWVKVYGNESVSVIKIVKQK